jgi:glucose-1-phosphate thymidylyltransferase
MSKTVNRVAVIMAGGQGTRLKPITLYINKHFFPVYNKPMIYYSMNLVIKAGIKKVLIICNRKDKVLYKKILRHLHKQIKIFYIVQNNPHGIAQGLMIARHFIKKSNVMFLLGDNFLYGKNLKSILSKANKLKSNCIFTHYVKNPKQYGVLQKKSNFYKIIEKPKKYIGNNAVIGIYFYQNEALKELKNLKKSKRGEYEVTDFNNRILNNNTKIITVPKSYYWKDLGTFDDLYDVSQFLKKNKIKIYV